MNATMKLAPAIALALAAGSAVLTTSTDAAAVSREEAVSRARAFAFHPYSVVAANQTASCSGAYQSLYIPGDYVGLPYDWGGYMTLFQFDQAMAAGYGAGSYPDDGILDCTVGLDCSGFLSKVWQLGHFTTSSFHQVTTQISAGELLPGDGFNDAGNHCTMHEDFMATGEPAMIESGGYNVHVNVTGGWSHVNGFLPRRRDGITGSSGAAPLGTIVNPIAVSSFPYVDSRNTVQSMSDMLDGCGADPSKSESGPEYVYALTFNQPGTLTVAVSDDAGVDIDVHVYTSPNTNDCFARHDSTLSVNVDCGTYYVVADTFKGASEYPGAYTLTADFSASGASCGNGPPSYDPGGELGDECAYPGNENLPFCNANLGADICLYGNGDSFCSIPCATDNDCDALPGGGCCEELGSGEMYCLTQSFCAGGPPPEETEDPETGDPDEVPDAADPADGTDNPDGPNGADPGGEDGATGDDDSKKRRSGGDEEDGGGCATAPGSTEAPGWLFGFAALALGALRRRRRA